MSLQMSVITAALRLMSRRSTTTADNLAANLVTRPVKRPSLRGVTITRAAREGMDVYTLTPPHARSGAAIVYLHGGAYVGEILGVHWSFARKLALETSSTVHVPIYPLAPGSTAEKTVPAVAAVVAALDEERLVLAGDSAGGGLAMAVAQQKPRSLSGMALIAPWVDVRTDSPAQQAIAPHDAMLRIDVVQAAGRLYAGTLDVADPRVSPLLGDLSELPPMEVWSGTHDILNVDAHELARRTGAVLHEGQRMQHCWPLFPFAPEATAARAVIAAACRRWLS